MDVATGEIAKARSYFFLIPNFELELADIPSGSDTADHWQEFAGSFPGYGTQHDFSGEISRAALESWEAGERPSGSLTELRSWLFIEQRRANQSEMEYPGYYEYLIDEIRREVEAGEHRRPTSDGPFIPPSAFPRPATAYEARKVERWPLVRFNPMERFEWLETSDLSGDAALYMARRHDVLYMLRKSGPVDGYEVLAFCSSNEYEEYLREPNQISLESLGRYFETLSSECADPKELAAVIAHKGGELFDALQSSRGQPSAAEEVARSRADLADALIHCFALAVKLGVEPLEAMSRRLSEIARANPEAASELGGRVAYLYGDGPPEIGRPIDAE